MYRRRAASAVARSVNTNTRSQLARVATRSFASQAPRASVNQGSRASLAVGLCVAGAAAGFWANSLVSADSFPYYGVPGTARERTFIAIKPDGVQRGLVGEVIRRFEAKGYKLVAIKLVHPTQSFAEQHYKDLSKKPFFPGLVKYFSSGPVVAMVWEGKNAIKGGRALVGATNPDDALPGSVRGDLAIDVGRNIIHGSDGPDSAKDEITLWFKENEVFSWTSSSGAWVTEKQN